MSPTGRLRMRLEPDPHRDVELVVARLRDGFVQGEIFLSTEIVALETLFQRGNRLLDPHPVSCLPVARRKLSRGSLQSGPELKKRCTSASEPTGTCCNTEESGC